MDVTLKNTMTLADPFPSSPDVEKRTALAGTERKPSRVTLDETSEPPFEVTFQVFCQSDSWRATDGERFVCILFCLGSWESRRGSRACSVRTLLPAYPPAVFFFKNGMCYSSHIMNIDVCSWGHTEPRQRPTCQTAKATVGERDKKYTGARSDTDSLTQQRKLRNQRKQRRACVKTETEGTVGRTDLFKTWAK